MERFWLCWVEWSDGGRHYKHWTREGAETECKRLAKLPGNAGKYVYILEFYKRCRVAPVPVEWERPNV